MADYVSPFREGVEDPEDNLNFVDLVDQMELMFNDENEAFVSIHTVDQINDSIAMAINGLHLSGMEELWGAPVKHVVLGMAYVMAIYKQLHDEIVIREVVHTIPDTPEELF